MLSKLHRIAESPAMPRGPFAVSKILEPGLKKALAECLMNFNTALKDESILKNLQEAGLDWAAKVPDTADLETYDKLQALMENKK